MNASVNVSKYYFLLCIHFHLSTVTCETILKYTKGHIPFLMTGENKDGFPETE